MLETSSGTDSKPFLYYISKRDNEKCSVLFFFNMYIRVFALPTTYTENSFPMCFPYISQFNIKSKEGDLKIYYCYCLEY